MSTEPGFLARHRLLILTLSVLLFLPPLALFFQATTGDDDFCGRWCPRMFFVWRQGMTGDQFLLGLLRSLMGVVLVGGILAATWFFGRAWCAHICPVGGATELGSRLVPRRLQIEFGGVPAPPVRYGYLAVYLLAPAFGLGSLCCSYCNFAAVPRLFGAAFSSADLAYFLRSAGLINLGLIFLLGFFARGGRAYCNLLCPVGALDALVSRLGGRFGRRVHLLPHRCTACGRCQEVCPNWAVSLGEAPRIDPLSCTGCRSCQAVCPDGAIAYGRQEHPLPDYGSRELPAAASAKGGAQ